MRADDRLLCLVEIALIYADDRQHTCMCRVLQCALQCVAAIFRDVKV